MPDYRRNFVPGGTFFFTVNLLQRRPNDLLTTHIELLRSTIAKVRRRYPFTIDAWVVLPDHLHCVWTLPAGDADYSRRWHLIKSGFSRAIPRCEWRSEVRTSRGERGIWQRRFWEHTIRDDRDFAAHVDYVHINPVKHGYVSRVIDWPHSTFHRYVRDDLYSEDWAGAGSDVEEAGERK